MESAKNGIDMKGITLEQLPEKYRRQAERQLAGNNSLSRTTPNVEPNTGHALLAKEESKGYNGQVNIRFVEYRHRLADPDGACVKYIIDSLVSCGILRGDSPKEINKIEKEQMILVKDKHEYTVIEITMENK